jgi:hypothetical protein
VPATARESPPLSRWVHVAVVIAVSGGAYVAGIATWWAYEPGNPLNPYVYQRVDVLQVNWTQFGIPVGSSAGFNVVAGAPESVSISLYCPNGTGSLGEPIVQNCPTGSVLLDTNGFGLASTNAPLQWSSGLSGANATITATVQTPAYAYTGNLSIWLVCLCTSDPLA